jgi:hypothetical protein
MQRGAYDQLYKALVDRDMSAVDTAAQSMDHIALKDSLGIIATMASVHDPRFDRAAARWLSQAIVEKHLSLQQTRKVVMVLEIMRPHYDFSEATLRGMLFS